jgi:clan AA aspartic protease
MARKRSALFFKGRSFEMGTTYAEITLKNSLDAGKAREGLIEELDVRSVTVQAVVDTGAMTLVINEELQQKLGLAVLRKKFAYVANGQRVPCDETEPVDIMWKNRYASVRAAVIPGARTVLLGAIPLENMDLMVNPVTQELVGIHGEDEVCLAL